MKYVHLTPQPTLKHVLRNGIRCGGGRRGRGVYAVPLMMLPGSEYMLNSETDDVLFLDAGKQTSLTLWRWLRKYPKRHRNMAAVIFEAPQSAYPADLYLEINDYTFDPDKWLRGIPSQNVAYDEDQVCEAVKLYKQAYEEAYCFRILNANGVGDVLHAHQATGSQPWSHFSESLEMVFRQRIDARHIVKTIALYKTTRQHKQRRDKQILAWS